MNWFYFAAVIGIFVFVNFTDGFIPYRQVTSRNYTEGTYNITDGVCFNAFASDMVFHDHVHKTRLPFSTRNATSTWYGDRRIYCLKVINEKDRNIGGTAIVKAGGVGHNFVRIEMHSQKGHGIEFTIQVFAK